MQVSMLDLGQISFKQAYSKQLEIQEAVYNGNLSNTLILCEHPHTITLGRQAKIDNILNYEFIKDNSVDLIIGVNRGGDVTYHGQGQLVGYFILDLRQFDRNLSWFLDSIENLIINTLSQFEIFAGAKTGYRGVWVGNKKIASIGIGVSKWITMHGFALNVNTDLKFFDIIRPCGLDVEMTSIQVESGQSVSMCKVKDMVSEIARHPTLLRGEFQSCGGYYRRQPVEEQSSFRRRGD